MNVLSPAWLLLLLPLLATFQVRRSRWLTVPRLSAYCCLVLAMSGLVFYPKRPEGSVIAVVDRSISMPDDHETAILEALRLLGRARPDNARLAVVSFGARPLLDRSPEQADFAEFVTQVDPHGSNLGEALQLGLGLLPEGWGGRLLVFSDGQWTGNDPGDVAASAVAAGVAVDYRHYSRVRGRDVAVSRLEAPHQVDQGQGFMVHAWVHSDIATSVGYRLSRDGITVAEGGKNLQPGVTRLTFRDVALQPGTADYTLQISTEEADTVPENNHAAFLVGVRGPRPVLLLSGDPNGSLAGLLAASGLRVSARDPRGLDLNLDVLSGFAAVILENVPAGDLGRVNMSNLAAWVEVHGGGLFFTGGRNSYAPGGYFRSPLEKVMPVSMELRREHRQFAMALVVAVDRSGSMAAPVGDGRTKMDLANLAAAEVIGMLSANDQFGHVAVDSAPHTIIPLEYVTQPVAMQDMVRRVASQGGGIFVFEALVAASNMLLKAESGARHIILFADAADSEEPGDYVILLDKLNRAGITVSVVGLGSQTDVDAPLLEDIAKRGQGNIYFTSDPTELPRIFAQDTFIMARTAFVDTVTEPAITAGMTALMGARSGKPPALGGYNLCYLRDGANLAMVSKDEYSAPLVASWHAGTGRVVCFTGEAAGKYAGPFASWPQVADFYTSLTRWAAGGGGLLADGSLVTQTTRDGQLKVTLHLDPERAQDPEHKPVVNVLRGAKNQAVRREILPMTWRGPDRLEASLPLHGEETLLGSVLVGDTPVPLAPVKRPFSPEYLPQDPNKGERVLRTLAATTGGVDRTRLDEVWSDLPEIKRPYALSPWLILTAVALLLLEVLQRRTALPRTLWTRLRSAQKQPNGQGKSEPQASVRVPEATAPTTPKASPEATPPKEPKQASDGLAGALAKARGEARKRLK